ncbi:MAG: hypothetical protein PHU27_05220 [Salinivirgaceae bacterium]|nr:hypothetical protein [Salinivirgaceae bacterium]MDD4747378.1 hypothetical protein [Salinivirgaceae bacterium]
MNSISLLINELNSQIVISKNNYEELFEELFLIAFLYRRDVIDNLEKNIFNLYRKIYVPAISDEKILLNDMHYRMMTSIINIAEFFNLLNEVNNVLEKKSLFYEVEIGLSKYNKPL